TNYGDISYLKEYSVGPGGRLKLKRDYAPTLWSATSLAFDPVAPFAYTNTEKKIIAYRVSCRCGLTTIQTIVVASKDERLYDVFIPKSGRYLYVEGYHSLWAYAIGRTGRLTPVGKPAVHAANIQNGAITSAPDGRCLYVAAIEPSSSYQNGRGYFVEPGLLYTYRILPSGGLSAATSTPKTMGIDIGQVDVGRDGRYIYINLDDNIYAASIRRDGSLGSLEAVADNLSVSTFALDKDSGYLYYAGHQANSGLTLLYRKMASGGRPTRAELVGVLGSNPRQILIVSR
ncbi:MAG: hypothetical protein ACLQVD_12860, partial [Capsulimonadaceae bacterium]